VASAVTQNERLVFDSWLASRIEDAKVEELYKKR